MPSVLFQHFPSFHAGEELEGLKAELPTFQQRQLMLLQTSAVWTGGISLRLLYHIGRLLHVGCYRCNPHQQRQKELFFVEQLFQ